MVGDVSLFKGEMTDTEKQNRSKFMKALNVLGKKGNAKLTFAILNPNEYFSANVTDGTLYIGADSFKTDQWAKDLVHEVTHLEEGTEEYDKLVQELLSDDILVDDGNGGKVARGFLAAARTHLAGAQRGAAAKQRREAVQNHHHGHEDAECGHGVGAYIAGDEQAVIQRAQQRQRKVGEYCGRCKLDKLRQSIVAADGVYLLHPIILS